MSKICPCGSKTNFACRCPSAVVKEFMDSPAGRIGPYLRVKKRDRPPKRKTDVWWVISNDADTLGEIKWYSAWRQYAFYPSPETVFNKDCMESLCAFIDKVNEDRKAEKRKADPKIIQTGIPEVDASLAKGIPVGQLGKFYAPKG